MYAKEKKLESAVRAVNLKIFTNIFAAYFDRKELYYLLNQALNLFCCQSDSAWSNLCCFRYVDSMYVIAEFFLFDALIFDR